MKIIPLGADALYKVNRITRSLSGRFDAVCLQKGLKNVFDEAILAALEPPEHKAKKRCLVL